MLIIVLSVLKYFLEKFEVSFAYLPCNVNRVKPEKFSVEMGSLLKGLIKSAVSGSLHSGSLYNGWPLD